MIPYALTLLLATLLLQPFRGFIPLVTTAGGEPKRGLALAYYHPEDLIQAAWYYQWGPCNDDPKCVPMSYSGEDPNLPAGYAGWLLVFNEPNNPAPYGAYLTPQEGAVRYLALKSQYPNAKMVVGNVSAWSLSWLIDFQMACNCAPAAWGMHGYVEGWITSEQLKTWWMQAHSILGGDFWITEWADASGNTAKNENLRQWLNVQPWITHWAYFTNRARGNEAWWPYGWDTQLFSMDGKLTPIGQWWNGFTMPLGPRLIIAR